MTVKVTIPPYTIKVDSSQGVLSIPVPGTTMNLADPVPTPTPTPTPAPTPTPTPTPATFWVYRDGLFRWTADFSFLATINYQDAVGRLGDTVIGVTITGKWGGFQPYQSPSFDVSKYNYLIVSLKPTVSNQIFATGFAAAGDAPDGTPITFAGPGITKYGPVPQAGVWADYKIPLADFGLTNKSILKFSIADGTGLASNKFYVDDLGFA